MKGHRATFSPAMAILDKQRVILEIDEAFALALDQSQETLVGLCFDGVISSRHRARYQEYLTAVTELEQGCTQHILTALKTGPKSALLAELQLHRRPKEGWMVGMRSVDEQRPLHRFLVAEERWRAILSGAEIGICILDHEARIVEANLPFLDAIGFQTGHGVLLSAEAVRGRFLFDFVEARAFAPVKQALDDARPVRRRFHGTVLTQERVLDVTLSPLIVPGNDTIGACLLAADKTGEAATMRLQTDLARAAGQAEIASGVLHNVGNVLNSASVATELLRESLQRSRLSSLSQATDVLENHKENLAVFLTQDPQGSKFLPFLSALTLRLLAEKEEMLSEVTTLRKSLSHIKAIVAQQNEYVDAAAFTERCKLDELVEDALSMEGQLLARDRIPVIRNFEEVPEVVVDRHKVLQILVNLIENARHALCEHGVAGGRIEIRIAETAPGVGTIAIEDNGVGIAKETITKIFAHGYSSRPTGQGFGLHHSVIAAQELGGSLTCESQGVGLGATFSLEFPPWTVDERDVPRDALQVAPAVQPVSIEKAKRGNANGNLG